jgi:hypothetical protein
MVIQIGGGGGQFKSQKGGQYGGSSSHLGTNTQYSNVNNYQYIRQIS